MRGYRAATAPVAAPAAVAVKAPPEQLEAVAHLFQAVLPPGEGTVGAADVLVHRTGPDSLLLVGEDEPAALVRLAETRVDAERGMVEDLTDALAWFAVEGPEAIDVMAQGVALDMRLSRWRPGSLRRTLCFGIEAYVHRMTQTGFRIGCAASHATWLECRLALACDPMGRPAPCR